MRRQSRPFVTEYRASGRRSRDHAGPQPAGTTAEPGRFAGIAEDVFRPKPVRSRDDAVEGAATGYEAAMRAADALFAVRKPEPVEAQAAAPGPDAKSGQATRRILQAIEEAPAVAEEAPFVEAIILPKPVRRGRKPGAKERPAPVASSGIAIEVATAAEVAAARAEEPEAEAPGAEAPLPVRRERRDPFPWVRTRLQPGERWKRRLPKVAW